MDAVTYALAKEKAKAYTDAVALTKADLVDGKIPASELPSYVDDILEYANVTSFPATGESGKIYVAIDTNYTYRWSGSAYVRVNEVDLSGYRTSAAQDVIDNGKQPTLISSGATVGQFAKISSVDANGKPTGWEPASLMFTITVTCVTQDQVTVTGQTVTVREGGATGQVYATATYNGQPVSFSVPKGFSYFVSVSDTLVSHFNPTTATGIINNASAGVTLTYSDFSTIRTFPDIKAALNAGTDLTELVGEQVTCTRNGTTLTGDVADYDPINKEVTILFHDTLPDNREYEPPQALAWFENGLVAGSYKFKSGSTYYYFTTTQNIPEGGQLRATTSAFTTYASQTTTAALESGVVNTTEISGATDLGTAGSGDLNHMDRVNYGSNNFKESGLFAFLNSDAAPNTNLISECKFSRPYNVGNYGGFLYGFDAAALACIENTVWKCSANNVYEAPASMGGTITRSTAYTVTGKFALASQKEVFGSYDGPDAGDSIMDLYVGATNEDRIKYYGTSARYWWFRSPYPYYAYHVRHLNPTGALNVNGANYSLGVVPACKIRKSD